MIHGAALTKNYKLNLYFDDSGSRELDRTTNDQNGSKWFALGGFLIKEEDEDLARTLHTNLIDKWELESPLHSYDIRQSRGGYKWLDKVDEETREEFFNDISDLINSTNLACIACVIDRAGYNNRYREKYGRQRWQLSKTAFPILIERSAKFAIREERKLNVYFEKSDKNIDLELLSYFREMKQNGMPFDRATSAAYNPLNNVKFSEVLYDCKGKNKSSPLMQIADLVLFPICVAGYDNNNISYVNLKENKKLIDDCLPNDASKKEGIKYSCFD